jgi:hypothetical protein
MEFLFSIMYAVLVAFGISALFTFGLRVRGPWGSFWTFFIVLFLIVWAADVWITPIGPFWAGIYWFPPLAVGLLIALLLAASTPTASNQEFREQPETPKVKEESASIALGMFFWIVLVLLIAAVVTGIFIK